ncbi:MAG: glycosyltransferase [Deltaproteobacteria bacterium]|nr:glycosyltransferase [Deltaproteobacteria bacterium]
MEDRVIAVLIPCFNEENTVRKVVEDFRRELPKALIYVYDNNSTDGTAKAAEAAGAIVHKEPRQGKGNVVRSMFREIEADIYIMVDGDDTYPASSVRELIKPVLNGEADMVIGTRLSRFTGRSFRKFHLFGNNVVVRLINLLFRSKLTDALSGYRAFGRLFVKTTPVISMGFEVETEMTIHALDKGFIVQEVPVDYGERPDGSVSKLDTFADGLLIIRTTFHIFKDYRPLMFFSGIAVLFFLAGAVSGVPVIVEYFHSGLVPRFPTAILASALVSLSFLFFSVGLILDTIARQHRENYELWVKSIYE